MSPLRLLPLLIGLAAGSASAQTLAIVHAKVETLGPAGEIASGVVIIRDGRIEAVGPDLQPPAGARVIDAQGQTLTPGLVAVGAPIGVSEVSEGVPETDDSETASDRLSAAFDPQYAINPWSLVIPTARLGGITDAVLMPGLRRSRQERPEPLLFGGQATVIRLAAGQGRLVRAVHAGTTLVLGEAGAGRVGGSRAAELVLLRSILDDVRAYARDRAAFDANRLRAMSLGREDLEALVPVVEGREPLIVEVHRAADILQVLDLAREQKLRVVLEGAEEAHMVAGEIAAAHAPVMVHAAADRPESFDQIGATLENPARLAAVGAPLVIQQPSFFTGARTPRIDAGRAVAHGLPWSAALAAITLEPARVFGLADRIGSIERGKSADLVLWSGDPLEPASAPTLVLIDGVEQPLRDRDLDLRDRYMPGSAAR